MRVLREEEGWGGRTAISKVIGMGKPGIRLLSFKNNAIPFESTDFFLYFK